MEVGNMFSVTGKYVLITGGSRGIGEMIAEGLVANGAFVIIGARDAAQCEMTANRLNALGKGRCVSVSSDMGRFDGVEHLVAKVKEVTGGKLHALINNSGKAWQQPIDEYDIKKGFDDIMFLNVTSPFQVTRLCLPLLEAAAEPNAPANVINIASIDGLRVPREATFSYSSSKAAFIALTKHLAHQLGPRNVTVNAICPGFFYTKMLAGRSKAALKHWNEPDHPDVTEFKAHLSKDNPLGRLGEGRDIAGTTIFLMSHAGSYVNGATITVDGGQMLGSRL